MTAAPEIVVAENLVGAAGQAADRIAAACARAVAARGVCAVALSGGETPKPLYARLASDPYRARIPWNRLHIFWGDERCVPPDDPRSNFRLAQEMLLAKVPVLPERIHRMPADTADHKAAAEAYERTLRAVLPSAADGWPRFDIVLLGVGDDAHTASLFPGGEAVRERTRAVVAEVAPHAGMWRMTLTVPVLTRADEILFLVAGATKAGAVQAAIEGSPDPAVPASLIRPAGTPAGSVTWFLDTAAASRLMRPASGRPAGRT